MVRLGVKLIVWAFYVALTCSLYVQANDYSGAGAAAFVFGGLGLVSLSKKFALEGGEDGSPGILLMFSIILLLGPVAFLHMLPTLLHDFGISSRVPDNSFAAIMGTLLFSVIAATYLWVPFLLYERIDRLFTNFEKRQAPDKSVPEN